MKETQMKMPHVLPRVNDVLLPLHVLRIIFLEVIMSIN